MSGSEESVSGSTPQHVAVVMDGNGRWARERGLPRIAGHRRGTESVRELVRLCGDRGIRYLTLFTFSSENWRRPAKEVNLLIDLFVNALEKETARLNENNVKLCVIGDLARFEPKVVKLINDAESLTAGNDALTLTLAVNYGGRWDIAQACREIAGQVVSGDLAPEAISDEVLAAALTTCNLPAPDLFIRTGGEQRISNFLLWDLAYTELYFTDTLWPDFGAQAFDLALDSFARRQRRFGRTGEQISQAKNA